MTTRDRDEEGRPRQARPRDELGRPLPYGATGVERLLKRGHELERYDDSGGLRAGRSLGHE